MKYSVVATAVTAVSLFSGAAFAAEDQPAWAGLIAGVSVASHQSGGKRIDIGGSNIILVSQGPTSGIPYSISVDRDATVGGVLVGYNWRSGSLIYGLEADYTIGEMDGSSRVTRFGGAVRTTASASVDNLFMIRGRFGFVPAERWLLGATAGLAVGEVDMRNNVDEFNGAGRQFKARNSETKTGWTIGLEAGYAVTSNLMLRADYTYYDLGKARSGKGTQSNPILATEYATYDSIKMAGELYRLSVLYRF